MKLQLTTLVRYQRGSGKAVDALATATSGAGGAGRYFVPGLLPCGECPACRRALVGACRSRRQVIPAGDAAVVSPELELPERFLCAVDDPPGLAALDDDTAVLAGMVTSALFAMAAAGAAPGDQALWLGGGPIAAAGVSLSRARGLKTAPAPGAAPAEPLSGHGRSQPLVFLTLADPDTLRQAAAAAEPGGTVVILSDGALALPEGFTFPADSRLILQGGYHPDLVPEALAALRRGEIDLPGLTPEVIYQRLPPRS